MLPALFSASCRSNVTQITTSATYAYNDHKCVAYLVGPGWVMGLEYDGGTCR